MLLLMLMDRHTCQKSGNQLLVIMAVDCMSRFWKTVQGMTEPVQELRGIAIGATNCEVRCGAVAKQKQGSVGNNVDAAADHKATTDQQHVNV
jgi:hypothetical protein